MGNTVWKAHQAAASLPADTAKSWAHLARAGISEFVDQRHTVGSYPMPEDGSVMRQLLDQTLACTDLVFIAPVYWFSLPSTIKAYLDHWSAWLRVPGLEFKAQMSHKRLWLITTNDDRAKAQPMIDSTAMCAKFLEIPLAGVLLGKGHWALGIGLNLVIPDWRKVNSFEFCMLQIVSCFAKMQNAS